MKRRAVLGVGAGIVGLGALAWWQRTPIVGALVRSRKNEGVDLTLAPRPDGEVCVLTGSQVEGPYFFSAPVRTDVREDRTGLEFDLGLQVVKADGCTPVEGAAVEIWHCDAAGNYSGYPEDMGRRPADTMLLVGSVDGTSVPPTNAGTYLRGGQITDATGTVNFKTIFPGWYDPRIPHIHVKVFHAGVEYLTTQLYFPDAYADAVYRSHADYVAYDPSPYNVGNDSVLGFNPEAEGLLIEPSVTARGIQALARLGIA